MKAVLRTRTLSEERGFMKALIAVDSDCVLGFTAFGAEAGELLPAVQIVMEAGLPYTLLRDAIITHPTMSEGLGPLFSKVATRTTEGSGSLQTAWIKPEFHHMIDSNDSTGNLA